MGTLILHLVIVVWACRANRNRKDVLCLFEYRLGGSRDIILLCSRYLNTASFIFMFNNKVYRVECCGLVVERRAEALGVTTQSGQHMIVHTGVMGMVNFTGCSVACPMVKG
jgi:hypothetical protein